MAMSVDGLVSGLSTTDMVNQLMQVEAMPQTALKNKVSAQNKAVTAYQDINTKLAALTTAAKALGSDESWNAVKATSSSDAAIVTTTTDATAGTFQFTVDKLATTHTVTYKDASVAALTDPAVSGNSITVLDTHGNPLPPVDVSGDKSLKGVVKAINDTAGAAYKASAVQIAPGRYTLQLTAVASGQVGKFAEGSIPFGTIDKLGEPTATTDGHDAEITVGSGGGQYTIKSSTNTFSDVAAGVSIAVTKETSGTPVTVSMAADKGGITDKVQALVDAANAALTQIKTATAGKNGTTAAGVLAGDPTVRSLSQEILSAVVTGAGSLGTLATVGITVDKGGTITFDKTKFETAYAADPAKTRSYFDSYTDKPHANAHAGAFDAGWDTANGIARKLETIGLKATEGLVLPDSPAAAREGLVTGLIKRRNESIAALNDQVEAWDARLSTRRAALQRQYSALEVALGKLKDQQSWLSGQLAGLS
jgi:flagellar hook-associated protein 2